MSLLFIDGFDVRDVLTRYQTNNIATVTTGTRFSYGAILEPGFGGNNYAKRNFPATTQGYIGFAYQQVTFVGQNMDFLVLLGDSNTTTKLSLRWPSNASGNLQIVRGDGTVLATTSTPVILSASTWYYLELGWKIDPSAGFATLRCNGVQVATFSGNTRNGTASSCDNFYLGNGAQMNNGPHFDDLYLCDNAGTTNNNFLGDVRVYTLPPTGAGANTGLTPSTAPNWDCVNETPPSATDYVSGTSGKDTYATTDLPATAASVLGVQVGAVAKKSDAGARSLKTTVRRGSTDYSDAGTVLGTSDVTLLSVRETDPSTSAAWTNAAVNAMEIGVEVA
jgi:hypothetical protein